MRGVCGHRSSGAPLGQTVDTLTLVSWYKQEGEAVAHGEPLFAVETDKATLDVEAPASGILRRVTAKPGDEVKVLSAIAVISAAEETAAAAAAKAEVEAGSSSAPSRLFVSPRARRLAEAAGVPLARVKATGPEGAIIERDVRAYAETVKAQVEAEEPVSTGLSFDLQPLPPDVQAPAPSLPLSGMRAVIAERMAASHSQTAPVTLTAEADATALVELCRQLRQRPAAGAADAGGVGVSYNDLFLAILAKALHEHPRLNAWLEGNEIKLLQQVDIGVAVDADRGLLVPVIRGVDRKGLAQLAADTAALTERARAGRCTPEELTGGTFTLTNLGMFGIDTFTPLINLPQCAILGVGRIKTQPVWIGEHVEPRQMVWLSLTFDHRLVDGGPAARFLQRVVELVEKPYLLLA